MEISRELLNELAWASSVGLGALKHLASEGSETAAADLKRAEAAVRALDATGIKIDEG